ncbi:glutathione peroxidase [Staphylococcus pseudintermedius]|uniref:glutathione peroxidase n=1 Tax=Staphylococcus pseudintermedius TaxID=283734 RepID=UPI000CD15B99|nr:glutathione peroxidase [Staphylococcus pseudintermedius]EGQ0296793.1 glutathione peroxidase [Staphylococcus pseudintermedius]EGQ0311109.1 glutathione peroxidase [Staphylococcus pseudintermedius]EGQ1275166.1 redoxin domain-containing protein [Staphylococcus pseudintermedius]EGQ1298651.1 redoxin domain-containing protein [Staphylococcus pseudintermedius]EGQ1315268.1 redoxin domain-containing protein [Staphylococcus pseudintermedius]
MHLYDIEVPKIDGSTYPLSQYKGDVLLIVNTASECGLTPQFEGLQKLYDTYRDKGFTILGFPSNQFGKQEPGSGKEASTNCQLNYGVTFPMHEKIEVNGDNAHPLYNYLKSQKSGIFGDKIKWNFTKFLVDRDGQVVKRFSPQKTPEHLKQDIEHLL